MNRRVCSCCARCRYARAAASWVGSGVLAAAVLSASADARADIIRTNAFGLGADAEVREQNGGDDPRGDHWELAARYTPPSSHNQHILTRFDLSGITAADLDANPLSSLRLFVNRTNWSASPAAFSYYALRPDAPGQLWNESTITFRNAPGLSYDGDMTTRGFTADALYLGDLPFEGARSPGDALTFTSSALGNLVRDALSYHDAAGTTPVLTLFVALKDGSPGNQNYIVKSNDANSATGTGFLSGTQYNPQLVFAPVPAGDIQSTWIGTTGAWSNGTLWQPAITPDNTATTTFNVTYNGINDGLTRYDRLELDQDVTIEQYNHGGSGVLVTAGAERTLTVNGPINWTGGTMAGGTDAGRLTVDARGGMAISGTPRGLSYVKFDNRGVTTYDPEQAISLTHSTNFNNHPGATFDIRRDVNLHGSQSWFTNDGTFVKSGGTGSSTIWVPVSNNGLVSVASGTLVFNGHQSSHRGTFTVADGATLMFGEYASPSQQIHASATIGGAGRVVFGPGGNTFVAANIETAGDVEIRGGRVFFQSGVRLAQGGQLKLIGSNGGPGLVDFSTGSTVMLADLDTDPNGEMGVPFTIQGTDDVVTTTPVNWRAGELWSHAATPPTFRVAAGMTISQQGMLARNRRLENASTLNWTGGYLVFGEGATFENTAGATLDIASDDLEFRHGPTKLGPVPVFNNAGTVVKSAGSGTSAFYDTIFNNAGTVDVQAGRLRIVGTADQWGMSTGTFNVVPGAELSLEQHTLASGSLVTGGGKVTLGGNRIDVHGQVDVSGTTEIRTTTTFHAGAQLTNLGSRLQIDHTGLATFNTGQTVTVNDLVLNGIIGGTDPLRVTGSMTGSGRMDGNLIAAGQLSPGNSIGDLLVSGNLALEESAELLMELSGAGFDYITVPGQMELNGLLTLTTLADYVPNESTVVTLISSAQPLLGTFDNIAPGERLLLSSGIGSFRVDYGAGSAFGSGSLVISDFQSVPEPGGTVTLLAAGAAMLGRWRRRRSSSRL